MRRGENEKVLTLLIAPPEEEALSLLEAHFVKGEGPASEQVREAVHDSYKRLLCWSMETETRLETKKRADEAAIRVFADNLRQLLLAPPLGQKNVLAIDPGFRTGCKVVCLDRQGKLLHNDTIYPHFSEEGKVKAAETLRLLVRAFQHRGHRRRQRHGGPRDGGLRPGTRPSGHPDHHGQRERRLGLLRLAGGPRGVPRPGRDGARLRLHRPQAHGPAGRARQDRPQGDRRGAVPARRRPGGPEAKPRRRRVELRQRRGRRGQHGKPPASDLRLGPGPPAGRQHRGLAQRARPLCRARGPPEGPPPGPQGLRAGGGLSAHPRRGKPARRKRRPPRELRRRRGHGQRSLLFRRRADEGRVEAEGRSTSRST